MLLLLHGDNIFESSAELSRLTSAAGQEITVINGESISDAGEIFASTESLSLFSEKRLTVVKRFWQNPKKNSLQKDVIGKLAQTNSKDLDLIFWNDTNVTKVKNKYKPGKKKPAETGAKKTTTANLAKYISEHGEIRLFQPLEDQQLRNWLAGELAGQKIQAPVSLIEQIIMKAGSDQFILRSEVEKLALFLRSQNRQQLVREDLDLVTIYHQENKIWELTDAISRRNRPLALKILNSLLIGPNDFPMLVAATLKQIKNIYLAKLYPNDRDRLISVLGLQPYAYIKISQFARAFELEQLRMLFTKLVNLDFTVKQGKIDVKLGFDLLLITL